MDWKIGDRRIFYIIDSDNSETVEADGEIAWIGDSLVVWLDRDLSRKLPKRTLRYCCPVRKSQT